MLIQDDFDKLDVALRMQGRESEGKFEGSTSGDISSSLHTFGVFPLPQILKVEISYIFWPEMTKKRDLEKLPHAAVQKPRGVWLVNIDKRRQHVLTRDLCRTVPCGLWFRKVVQMSGLAPLWIHCCIHGRAAKPEPMRVPVDQTAAHQRLLYTRREDRCSITQSALNLDYTKW